MLDLILRELLGGEDAQAEQAALELAALPAEEVLEALQAPLASSDPEQRWWAARALAEVRDPRAPVLLADLLQDPDAAVRQCAALGLRVQPEGRAVPALVRSLKDDDPLTARLAGDALAAIGGEAVPALFEALERGSSLAAYWAEEGLERLGVGMVFFRQ